MKTLVAGLAMALLVSTGSFAGDLNEVGAFLVYPTISNVGKAGHAFGPLNQVETFVTITNAGSAPVVAHVSYINGDSDSDQYCYECDFEVPLTPNDTETLVITTGPGGIAIENEDNLVSMSCPWEYGMLVVALQDALGATITENVLLGEEVIVDYTTGSAVSIPAIPFQGLDGGDGDRVYSFDDAEYSSMPRIVAADFLAPRINDPAQATVLSLFTLGFERQFPPLTDCSVTGFDAREHPFSASFQFGCWGVADLCSISPEFCYPNLGLNAVGLQDTHGWLQLNCRVDSDPQSTNGFDADGGVHGAIIDYRGAATTMPAGSGTIFAGSAAWARLLYQSVTTGDAVTLLLETPAQGLF
jgi:hypothetical protein